MTDDQPTAEAPEREGSGASLSLGDAVMMARAAGHVLVIAPPGMSGLAALRTVVLHSLGNRMDDGTEVIVFATPQTMPGDGHVH